MSGELIELHDIVSSAQNTEIIHSVSLSFKKGDTTAIIGPSGGGKSTVLKIADGLIVPDSGEVLYLGKDIQTLSQNDNLSFRKESAFVFQDSALWANQSIRQILELPLKIHFPSQSAQDRLSRIKEVLTRVGYKRTLDIRPAALSTGEQKLVAFARALLCKPSILFLDEWTESLDEAAAARLIKIVKAEKVAGTTVIFVSHDFPIVDSLADTVCMVLAGKVILAESMERIRADTKLLSIVKEGIDS